MKLTALEIKQQTFDKSIRGFDIAEVQAFLNLISNEWEHLVTRNKELEQQITKLNERLKHYERVESALHETLQTAKDSAEQKMESAKKDSRNIIERAELEADGILMEASQQRQQIRQSILSLLDRRNEIIGGIRSYLENANESVQQFSRDEARLFTIPSDGQDGEKKTTAVNEFAGSAGEPTDAGNHAGSHGEGDDNYGEEEIKKEKRKSKHSINRESSSFPEEADDMDDILDQIE